MKNYIKIGKKYFWEISMDIEKKITKLEEGLWITKEQLKSVIDVYGEKEYPVQEWINNYD